jgi:hypothetical protein
MVLRAARRRTLLGLGSRTLELEAGRARVLNSWRGRLRVLSDSEPGSSTLLLYRVNQALNPKLVAVPAGNITQA